MLVKAVIIILIILMLVSLGSALIFMMKGRGKTDRTVKALTWRVGIWVVLLAFILVAAKLGWLEPSNSLSPKVPASQTAPAEPAAKQ